MTLLNAGYGRDHSQEMDSSRFSHPEQRPSKRHFTKLAPQQPMQKDVLLKRFFFLRDLFCARPQLRSWLELATAPHHSVHKSAGPERYNAPRGQNLANSGAEFFEMSDKGEAVPQAAA